jgi:hypothetical protein
MGGSCRSTERWSNTRGINIKIKIGTAIEMKGVNLSLPAVGPRLAEKWPARSIG